jgi:hypothetical protein
MNIAENCAYCNSSNTDEIEYTDTFDVNGTQLEVNGLKLNHCNDCESESIPMDLVDYNLAIFMKAQAIHISE